MGELIKLVMRVKRGRRMNEESGKRGMALLELKNKEDQRGGLGLLGLLRTENKEEVGGSNSWHMC